MIYDSSVASVGMGPRWSRYMNYCIMPAFTHEGIPLWIFTFSSKICSCAEHRSHITKKWDGRECSVLEQDER